MFYGLVLFSIMGMRQLQMTGYSWLCFFILSSFLNNGWINALRSYNYHAIFNLVIFFEAKSSDIVFFYYLLWWILFKRQDNM